VSDVSAAEHLLNSLVAARLERADRARRLRDGSSANLAQQVIDAYVDDHRGRPMAFHLDAGRAAEAGALMRYLRSQGFSSTVSLTNQPAGLIVAAIPRGAQ
jgi:hypothetical protein